MARMQLGLATFAPFYEGRVSFTPLMLAVFSNSPSLIEYMINNDHSVNDPTEHDKLITHCRFELRSASLWNEATTSRRRCL